MLFPPTIASLVSFTPTRLAKDKHAENNVNDKIQICSKTPDFSE